MLVAATHAGKAVGMLANSFTSVSLDPPLVQYLGAMLGLSLEASQLDRPLTPAQLNSAHASPDDPHEQ